MVKEIVRVIPSPIDIPKWIDVWNEIPDSNTAKAIFYDNKIDNILTHVPQSQGYEKVLPDDFQSMLDIVYVFNNNVKYITVLNTELENLRTRCSAMFHQTDFIVHGCVKYGNSLKNIQKMQKERYSAIERELPKYHDIPTTPPQLTTDECKINIVHTDLKNVSSTTNVLNWLCVIHQSVSEQSVTNDEQIYKVKLEKCKTDHCKYCAANQSSEDYFEMSGKTIVELSEIYLYNIRVKENKSLMKLYKTVHSFTSPFDQICYKGVNYGNPNLTMQFKYMSSQPKSSFVTKIKN